MSSPKLTALVSVYKSSRWLRDRIDNLMNTELYKRRGLLIYLINASSPDGDDEAICRSFIDHPNVRYERIPHCTVYGAWSHAITRTDTPFLTNANSDDLISPEAYDIMIEVCEKKDASLAFCDWITIGDGVRKWSEVAGMPGNGISAYNPSHDQMSCGHFPLWRRSLHDRIGLFDPQFQALGDADFWYRAWVSNIRDFEPINSPLAAYRWRDGDNLWSKTPEDQRSKEWSIMRSRQPGRLEVG